MARVEQLARVRVKLFDAAKSMDTKWALAEETRQRATIAFMAGPYPKSGFPVIPQMLFRLTHPTLAWRSPRIDQCGT